MCVLSNNESENERNSQDETSDNEGEVSGSEQEDRIEDPPAGTKRKAEEVLARES